jgi:flagellar biosynthesis protein FlhG
MIVAVASGQEGAGKTNVSLNLAIALSRLGKRVWLLDADMGQANVNVLLGAQPAMTLYHVLFEEKTLDEVALNGPSGVKIIPGGLGIQELVRINKLGFPELSSAFSGLVSESDFMIVDTSSEISPENLAFSQAADAVIAIFTPEQTSLADGFSVVQILCVNQYAGGIYLLPNMFDSTRSAATTTEKIKAEAAKSFSRKLEHLPPLPRDKAVTDAGVRQMPFMEVNPSSAASIRMGEIAAKVVSIAAGRGDNKTAPADYILGVVGYANDTKLISLVKRANENQLGLDEEPPQDSNQPEQEPSVELTPVGVGSPPQEAILLEQEPSVELTPVGVGSPPQEAILLEQEPSVELTPVGAGSPPQEAILLEQEPSVELTPVGAGSPPQEAILLEQEPSVELTPVGAGSPPQEAIAPRQEPPATVRPVSVGSFPQYSSPPALALDAEWRGGLRDSGEFMKHMEVPIKTMVSLFEKNVLLYEKTLEILSDISERISNIGHLGALHADGKGLHGKSSSPTLEKGVEHKSVEVVMDFDRFVLNKLQANKPADKKAKV